MGRKSNYRYINDDNQSNHACQELSTAFQVVTVNLVTNDYVLGRLRARKRDTLDHAADDTLARAQAPQNMANVGAFR